MTIICLHFFSSNRLDKDICISSHCNFIVLGIDNLFGYEETDRVVLANW